MPVLVGLITPTHFNGMGKFLLSARTMLIDVLHGVARCCHRSKRLYHLLLRKGCPLLLFSSCSGFLPTGLSPRGGGGRSKSLRVSSAHGNNWVPSCATSFVVEPFEVNIGLVLRRYGLADVFGSELDQRSIELDTKIVPISGLVIDHLVVHVAQVVVTFHRSVPPFVEQATVTIALAVSSSTRRTAFSAIPLVSER